MYIVCSSRPHQTKSAQTKEILCSACEGTRLKTQRGCSATARLNGKRRSNRAANRGVAVRELLDTTASFDRRSRLLLFKTDFAAPLVAVPKYKQKHYGFNMLVTSPP